MLMMGKTNYGLFKISVVNGNSLEMAIFFHYLNVDYYSSFAGNRLINDRFSFQRNWPIELEMLCGVARV